METGELLSVYTRRWGDVAIVEAWGELDLATAPKLVHAVKDASRQEVKCVVLEFKRVSFIDSEIFKSLLALKEWMASQGQTLLVGNCSMQVSRAMRLLGLGSVLGGKAQNVSK